MKARLVLIGPGRVGQTVAHLLRESGYEISALIGRDIGRVVAAADFIGIPHDRTSTERAKAKEGEIILFALPDDILRATALQLHREGHLPPDAVLVHFSGRHPASILQNGASSHPALSLHPLQSFASPSAGLKRLPDCPVAVEGSEEAIIQGEQIARDMGGVPFRLRSEDKPLYHAAAAVASNYMVGLAAIAQEILSACNLETDTPLDLLMPLMQGTLDNLKESAPQEALTGPIVRGDIETVKTHLQALKDLCPSTEKIYRMMGQRVAELAKENGRLRGHRGVAMTDLLKN